MSWDPDIAALKLSDVEKNGLQIYRNYTRSFEDHAEKIFAKDIDAINVSLADLTRLLDLILSEDVRLVPVLACAYIDDLLKAFFKEFVPSDVPGGKANLIGSYGPLSDLAKRITLAFVFDLASKDLLEDIDRLRSARNTLSHTWDAEKVKDFFTRGRVSEVFPIDEMIGERTDWFPDLPDKLPAEVAFRIRTIWLLVRISYELPLYSKAKEKRLQAGRALYGSNHPALMTKFAKLAMETCRRAIKDPPQV